HPACYEIHGDEKRRTHHSEIEIARQAQVRSECGVFQMPHTRWTNAALGESIVEPRRGAVTQVRTKCNVNRSQDLQQYEDRADKPQRIGQICAPLNALNERSH